MTSTDLNIGMSEVSRPSSRVLKPPGGGHSNIFAEDDVKPNPPRPRYNQQNSSNLNVVMNTSDPNSGDNAPPVQQETRANEAAANKKNMEASSHKNAFAPPDNATNGQSSKRIPPGGFSSGGFW